MVDNCVVEVEFAHPVWVSVPEGCVPFNLKMGEYHRTGLFVEDTIWVHSIVGTLKPFMDFLVKKFNTIKVVFTPVINDNVLMSVRGFVKKSLPADHPENPYGEEMFYLEGEWEISGS